MFIDTEVTFLSDPLLIHCTRAQLAKPMQASQIAVIIESYVKKIRLELADEKILFIKLIIFYNC